MDTNAAERLIASISWEYVPATVIAKDGSSLSLLLRSPTTKEQAKAAVVYDREYSASLLSGLSRENDIIDNLVVLEQWSHRTDEEISGLHDDIYKIRRGLLDFVFDKTKLEKTRALLRRAEAALVERLVKRKDLTTNSAESHSLICQQRYLISCITETEDGNLFWATRESFEEFDDIGIITQLCKLFFKHSRLSPDVIRELARSQSWRVYWEIAKNTGNLFDNNIISWSGNQRELVYWSTIYDSVYGAYERPSQDIIQDDDLLDSWFIRQSQKTEKGSQQHTIPKANKPGRNEEFIMADREGAKRVYDMNDPGARTTVRARQKVLQRHGSVREQDMPDSQMEMREQLASMQKNHVKDITRR